MSFHNVCVSISDTKFNLINLLEKKRKRITLRQASEYHSFFLLLFFSCPAAGGKGCLLQSLLEADQRDRVNSVQVVHSHPSWSTKVTPKLQPVPNDGVCHQLFVKAPPDRPHFLHPQRITVFLTFTNKGGGEVASTQRLFIYEYFQELHVQLVLDFVNNGHSRRGLCFITVLELNQCMWHPATFVVDVPLYLLKVSDH